jgi:hypothetical protein
MIVTKPRILLLANIYIAMIPYQYRWIHFIYKRSVGSLKMIRGTENLFNVIHTTAPKIRPSKRQNKPARALPSPAIRRGAPQMKKISTGGVKCEIGGKKGQDAGPGPSNVIHTKHRA